MKTRSAEPGEGCSFVWAPSPLNGNKGDSRSSISEGRAALAGGGGSAARPSSSRSAISDEIKKLWMAAEKKDPTSFPSLLSLLLSSHKLCFWPLHLSGTRRAVEDNAARGRDAGAGKDVPYGARGMRKWITKG